MTKIKRRVLHLILISLAYWTAVAAQDSNRWIPDIPKTWDEAELADWATPIAGLNLRPSHISAEEYDSLPVQNLRSYPLYMPGREPEGYWDMLQHIGPKPLIEAGTLTTQDDWIKAGQRVFEEAISPQLTTFDPNLIAQVRNRQFMESQGARAFADGALDFLRWLPTKAGVALTASSCSACHVLHRSDGSHVPGAPGRAELTRTQAYQFRSVPPRYLEGHNHVLGGAPPFIMGGSGPGGWLYQAYGVPWLSDDVNARLKDVTAAEYESLIAAYRRSGGTIRWNGSLFYPAKIPDLIGIQDRKYFDHSATHLHRGIGDLMRYAAQVAFAEMTDFGSYHMLSHESKRLQARLPDHALYALALYIYSLKPPPNPNQFDQTARAGRRIFTREGCMTCHTPPLYTSNKLTLATGFTPPKDAPPKLDIVPISVGTDPGLALKTRKGTGYYKIPSLKGLWYRGHYLHDGSATSLEEMFDPERLKETHVPGGWLSHGEQTHAIPGHQPGLNLKPEERAELICFSSDTINPDGSTGKTLMHAPYLLFGMALVPMVSTLAQSKRSFEGAWRAVQVTVGGQQPVTIKPGPNLTIFSARHYSRIDVQTDTPRPVLTNPSAASAQELRETWGPLVAEGGTYERSDNLITLTPMVAKNPAAMAPGVSIVYSYKLEGDTLMLTAQRDRNGPVANPFTVKLVRIE